MRNTFAGIVICLVVLTFSVETAHSKTWKGIWDGQAAFTSTLDFLGGNRLTYCFQSQCHTAVYFGSEKGTVKFNWGTARFSFKWNGSGYDGVRRAGATTNRTKLK